MCRHLLDVNIILQGMNAEKGGAYEVWYMKARKKVCMYVCMLLCMFVFCDVCMYACFYECVCVSMYECMYVSMYV